MRDAGHGVVARIEANAAFRAKPPDHLTESSRKRELLRRDHLARLGPPSRQVYCSEELSCVTVKSSVEFSNSECPRLSRSVGRLSESALSHT